MSAAPRVVATIVHSSRVSCFTRLLCPPPASPLKGEVLRDAAGTRSRVVVRCIHHRLLLTRLSLNPAVYPLLAHQLRGRGHRGAVGASSQVPVARRVAQSLQTSPDVEDTRSCYDSNEAPRHEQRVLWQRLRESLLWWGVDGEAGAKLVARIHRSGRVRAPAAAPRRPHVPLANTTAFQVDNGAGDALLASSQAERSSSGCAAAVCAARNSRSVLALPRWSPAAERATTTTATTMRSYL